MNEHNHKLYTYEVTPPVTCWDNIEAELDASDMAHHYPARIREYGITPPVSAWENITSSLDAGKSGSPIRRFSPLLKYAAAAAIIGILAWGGFSLVSGNKKPGEDLAIRTPKTISPTIPVPGQSTNREIPVDQPALADTDDDIRDHEALEASKKTYASINVNATKSKIRNVSNFFFMPDATSSLTRGIDIADPDELDEPADVSADRYYTVMTPEGNIIRMAKKWGDLVCCVSGEERDVECMEQMKKWQQQMASPNHGHAAGSFMDILGLLKSLQDNEL